MIDMKIPVLFICHVKFCLHSDSRDAVVTDVMDSLVFELSFIFQDQLIYEGGHPLHHDDEAVAAFVHVLDVALAEVPAVKNEAVCNTIKLPQKIAIRHETCKGRRKKCFTSTF